MTKICEYCNEREVEKPYNACTECLCKYDTGASLSVFIKELEESK